MLKISGVVAPEAPYALRVADRERGKVDYAERSHLWKGVYFKLNRTVHSYGMGFEKGHAYKGGVLTSF